VDSEEEDRKAEDVDVQFDKIEKDEQNKESKEKLEKYLNRVKKNLKLADGCDQDETDIPQNVDEVNEDIEDVFNMWNEKEEECFKQCSKRKIQSVCTIRGGCRFHFSVVFMVGPPNMVIWVI
jgi:hypothetical protein